MAVRTARVMPTATTPLTLNVAGRVYTFASATTPLDIPSFDADQAEARGYLRMGLWSGPTTSRPKSTDSDLQGSVLTGTEFYDTSLSVLVKLDATGSWRNGSGSIV